MALNSCVVEEKPELTERVYVSPESKQALNGMKQKGERIGDVIERLLLDHKQSEFIAYLDSRAKSADYVPIEADPEMARMLAAR